MKKNKGVKDKMLSIALGAIEDKAVNLEFIPKFGIKDELGDLSVIGGRYSELVDIYGKDYNLVHYHPERVDILKFEDEPPMLVIALEGKFKDKTYEGFDLVEKVDITVNKEPKKLFGIPYGVKQIETRDKYFAYKITGKYPEGYNLSFVYSEYKYRIKSNSGIFRSDDFNYFSNWFRDYQTFGGHSDASKIRLMLESNLSIYQLVMGDISVFLNHGEYCELINRISARHEGENNRRDEIERLRRDGLLDRRFKRYQSGKL